MQTQLLEDLQSMQKKADDFFKEAQKDKSEHGAGYFFLARKIDRIIGYVTGVRDTSKIKTLQDLLDRLKKIGLKHKGDYRFTLQAEIRESGIIKYSGRILGTLKGDTEQYGKYEYLHETKDFGELVNQVIQILEKDDEERAKLPQDKTDIVVK